MENDFLKFITVNTSIKKLFENDGILITGEYQKVRVDLSLKLCRCD